jgi:hypothetical protein
MSFTFSYFIEKGSIDFHAYKKERMEELFVHNTPYDILFIGSSRTYNTIDPQVIDSITGLRSYNGGISGGNIGEFKLTLDGYLAAHPAPRFVVVSIDAQSFDSRKSMFFPFQYFWVLQNPVVRKAVAANKDFRFFVVRDMKLLRQIYYDDYTKGLALRGLLGQNEYGYYSFTGKQGFATNGYSCVDTTSPYPAHDAGIEPGKVALLHAIADTCKARNISLLLTYAPEYRHRLQQSVTNFRVFEDTMQQFASKRQLNFFREDYLPMCNNPCLFANYGHVNAYGALEYSRILGHRIADSLLLKN